VAEDSLLIDSIRVYMWEDILPALGHAQAPPHVSQSTGSMPQSCPVPLLRHELRHESGQILSQDFELNDQTRRYYYISSFIISSIFVVVIDVIKCNKQGF